MTAQTCNQPSSAMSRRHRPRRAGGYTFFAGLSILAVTALLLVAALLPSSALASRTSRPYQSSFGFVENTPGAVAVDQASGDIYAAARGSRGSVSRFTAAGAPDNFTVGASAGTNTLTDPAEGFGRGIAIDNASGPLAGDIFVLETANSEGDGKVKVFSPTGASLGTLTGANTPQGKLGHSICGVAIDQSTGALYIAEAFGEIWRFLPSSPAGTIDDSDFTLTGIAAFASCDIAADSGKVYVTDSGEGTETLKRYLASDFTSDFTNTPTPTTIDIGELNPFITAVAVDPRTGEVYVNEGYRVAVFSSAGVPLYVFGAAAYFGNLSHGVAVKSAPSGPATTVYVADPQAGSHEIDAFGPIAKAPTFTRPSLAAFGPDGSSASSFPREAPSSLAFGQAGRRLYAVDSDTPGIHGFDASAPPAYSPLAAFDPLSVAPTGDLQSGLAPGLAVDNTALGSAGNLYLASGATNQIYGWSSTGSPLGVPFPLDPASTPGPPSGSPTQLCGSAVDSAGDLWVANGRTNSILRYSSAGAVLPGAIDTSAQGSPCRLAFDANDDLYVTIIDTQGFNTGVWRYTASSGYSAATRIASTPTAEKNVTLAVDPSNHHLYIVYATGCNSCNTNNWVDEYDGAGNFLDEFATQYVRQSTPGLFAGVAVDAQNHDLFLTDSRAGKIRVFGPGVLLPEVSALPASAIANTTATLEGTVNGQGIALSDCHFDYVPAAAFRLSGFSDLSSGGSVPCSPSAGSIPADLEDHTVGGAVTGLSQNTVYRFRLSAANTNGASNADGSFTSAGPPLVETTGSPVRTTTTVHLKARLDPSRAATTYHFEYGEAGPCDTNPCESTEAQPAGSGDEFEFVSQQVAGLQAGITYHYRVVADNGNAAGVAFGADMAVTTRSSDAPLSHGHFPGPPGSDRAYELVSMPDAGGNPISRVLAVSDSGDRAFYRVSGGTPISTTGTFLTTLFSERTPQGWRSEDVDPPRNQQIGVAWLEPAGKHDLSDQLTYNVGSAGGAVWRVRPGQPPVKVYELGPNDGPLAASEDASRALIVAVESLDPAHPVAEGTAHLYDVSSGVPKLVDLMPDGSVSACKVVVGGGTDGAGTAPESALHAVSPDGSLVFFRSCGQLYVRDLNAEETKLIGPAGGFIKSTPGAVFFTTNTSLDPNDGSGSDIYRYDLASESLRCVTCVAAAGLDADVIAVAVAADGSRAYFVSKQALLPGAATPGIYRVDVASADLAYVAPGSSVGEGAFVGQALTPDGAAVVFPASSPALNELNGEQNGGTLQYYRYDDRDRSLTCLSCPQDGSVPSAPAGVGNGGSLVGATEEVGANKTTLSADGEIFAFATPNALLPGDQNTARAGQKPTVGGDVYEWRDGRLLLVSDGLKSWPEAGLSPVVSAMTPSGKDVFFTAGQQLTPDALDGFQRLYDARIGGGIEFPPPPKPCPLEVCQGTPKGAPEEQAPGSGTFAGPGNAHPRAHHRKKKHVKKKRQHKKQNRKQATHNRRAAR